MDLHRRIRDLENAIGNAADADAEERAIVRWLAGAGPPPRTARQIVVVHDDMLPPIGEDPICLPEWGPWAHDGPPWDALNDPSRVVMLTRTGIITGPRPPASANG